MFKGIWIINIYAPSGVEKQSERECFYTTDVTYLLSTASNGMINAGDFNCFVSPAGCAGKPSMSHALATLVKGMGLRNMWETHTHCPAYTHYTNDGAARIDRFYATETLIYRKQGAETVAAAFPDHFAVIVLMTFDTPRMMCRARVWRMNITLLEEIAFREAIKEQ